MQIEKPFRKKAALLGVSALALSGFFATDHFVNQSGGKIIGSAFASSHSGSGNHGGSNGKQGSGHDHSHDDGDSDDHDHDDATEDDHTHEDSEGGKGKGPKYGGGTDASDSDAKGKRPVWAKEGIPEIELGRLNVARAPGQVLDRAYDEALSNFTVEMAAFYDLPLNQAIEKLRTEFGTLTIIDSPLQNLALLRDALDGSSILNTLPQVSNSNETLMAIFLGGASDKTIPISPETAYSIALILGFELSEAASTALATDAEAVRAAILEGHG